MRLKMGPQEAALFLEWKRRRERRKSGGEVMPAPGHRMQEEGQASVREEGEESSKRMKTGEVRTPQGGNHKKGSAAAPPAFRTWRK